MTLYKIYMGRVVQSEKWATKYYSETRSTSTIINSNGTSHQPPTIIDNCIPSQVLHTAHAFLLNLF